MAVTAEQSAGAGANSGAVAWQNPGNIVTPGTPYADATINAGVTTGWLQATSFGFAAAGVGATDTIDGIEMRFNRYTTGPFNAGQDNGIYLFYSAANQGANQSAAAWWTIGVLGYSATYGGAANKWGAAPTATDVRSAGFGCAIQAINGWVAANKVYVDVVKMTVYYTPVALRPGFYAQVVGILPAVFVAMLRPFLFRQRSVTRSAGLVRV